MRHDTRLLYLTQQPLCPCPVSVRLPTGSCKQGCFFCCTSFYFGKTRLSLRHVLTKETFLRLWEQIIFNNDFKFVWPQSKILKALQRKRVLRFVREDLFEPSLTVITKRVLLGCYRRDYGILVKTSSINVVNYMKEIKKIGHCIVFSVTDLLKDYSAKIEVINTLIENGLNVTLSLTPIYEFNDKTRYILEKVNKKVLGVEVGWLHSPPSLIPAKYLNRDDYKYVRWEKQYKKYHLLNTVGDIRYICDKRGIPLSFYFSSYFYKEGACCFVDRVF